jgi:hypothetical protein
MGLDPHPLFSTEWYLRHYEDVADADMNPLVHYLRFGWSEGRHPSPLFHPQAYAEVAGLQQGLVDPLEHFVTVGAGHGLSPSPILDPVWYRRRHGLTGGDALMPIRHYVAFGLAGGLAASSWELVLRERLNSLSTNPPSDALHRLPETAQHVGSAD